MFIAVNLLVMFNALEIPAQKIVAHRGASADAPENTISAFQLAWKQGADAIEGDFHLTKDGKIVCIHDADTKKVAGKNLNVATTNYAELSKLDVGKWKHAKFAEERIPLLSEVLAIVPKGKQILIEVKCGPEIVSVLQKELAKCKLEPSQLAIISFQKEVIALVKKRMPKIKAFWLTSIKQNQVTKKWSPTLEQIVDTLKETNADGLDVKAELQIVDAKFVERLRAENVEFHCWTVDDPTLAKQMRQLGVDSITTNRPKFLREKMAAEK